jgi:hypothetical protein
MTISQKALQSGKAQVDPETNFCNCGEFKPEMLRIYES